VKLRGVIFWLLATQKEGWNQFGETKKGFNLQAARMGVIWFFFAPPKIFIAFRFNLIRGKTWPPNKGGGDLF